MRLQKYLSAAGVCSRRKGEKHILVGRVSVNGEVISQLGVQVDPEKDEVRFDGKLLQLTKDHLYIALNKPVGVVSSCDHRGKKLVVDLVDVGTRIYPVGRLDKDSEGLLLLTNDGALHQRLSHPKFGHEKEYQVTVMRPIDDRALQRMREGVLLGEKATHPAQVKRTAADRFSIILKEGRNRQIRRMAKAVRAKVKRLIRVRIAHIRLGDLKSGKWRHLTDNERKRLLKG